MLVYRCVDSEMEHIKKRTRFVKPALSATICFLSASLRSDTTFGAPDTHVAEGACVVVGVFVGAFVVLRVVVFFVKGTLRGGSLGAF
jgi:hypothetical protein